MRLDKALKMEREDFEQRMKVRFAKAHDYANEDVLANFKVRADVYKALKDNGMEPDLSTPHGVAFWDAMLKMLRRVNLYKKGVSPKNESMKDTFLDNSNYVDLEKECFIDYCEDQDVQHAQDVQHGGKDGS